MLRSTASCINSYKKVNCTCINVGCLYIKACTGMYSMYDEELNKFNQLNLQDCMN